MSMILKSKKLLQTYVKNKGVVYTFVRNHWNKDYKPGPLPRTEQERIKAAEKYNLHPSEYKTYPDDGQGWGDYPKLPLQSIESKDPFYPYDNPELKRNFNEPFHVDYDLIREDRYDVSYKRRQPNYKYWVQFLGVMFTTFGIYWTLEYVKMFHPLTPLQFPKEGVTHYTFELVPEEVDPKKSKKK